MRCLLLALSLLLLTSPVSAAPLLLQFNLARDGHAGGGHIEFGRDHAFQIQVPVVDVFAQDQWLPIHGALDWTSTHFEALTVGSNPPRTSRDSTYHYGPGQMIVTLEWAGPAGQQTGRLIIPMAPFSFTAWGEDVEKGCCDYPYIDQTIPVGAGTFDPSLAAYFGTQSGTLGGTFGWFSDAISGDESSTARRGRLYLPWLQVNAVPVVPAIPEPATLVLLGLGGVAVVLRQRRR